MFPGLLSYCTKIAGFQMTNFVPTEACKSTHGLLSNFMVRVRTFCPRIVQGGPSRGGTVFVDIKLKVPQQY